MPESSEIRTKLSADASEYNSVMTGVGEKSEAVFERMAHHFTGTQFLAHALATSLGLNIEKIAEGVAEFVTGMTEQVRELYKKSAEDSDRSLAEFQAEMKARRGESQQAAGAQEDMNALKAEEVRLQKEIGALEQEKREAAERRQRAEEQGLSTFEDMSSQELKIQQAQNKLRENADLQEKAAAALAAASLRDKKLAVELEQSRFEKSLRTMTTEEQLFALAERGFVLWKRIDEFKGAGIEKDALIAQQRRNQAAIDEVNQKRNEEGQKRALDNDDEILAAVDAHREQLELEAKLMEGRLLPADRARLDVLRLQVKVQENERNIRFALAVPAEQRTQAEKDALAAMFHQRDVLAKQIEQKLQLVAETENEVKVEQQVGQQIKSNVDQWTGFITAVTGRGGRGDDALTDRELQAKIRNLRQQQFQSELGRIGRVGVGNELGNDPASGVIALLLQQALAESTLRTTVRRTAGAFGQDAAANQFPGLTQQKLDDILRGAPADTEQQRLTAALEDLTKRLARGIVTIPLPGSPGNLMQTGQGTG